jgi:ZIP family zinc transporter
MIEKMAEFGPVMQALFGGLFTWFITAAGAALVLFVKKMNKSVLDSMLGFAAGVMIAASFWSLLAPAIEMSGGLSVPKWFPAAAGFVAGGAFLYILDKIIPHLHPGLRLESAEGIHTTWKRSVLLVSAITLHNIPEGLAIGVAFGAAASGFPEATLGGAMAVALGIGIQNFPEGTAVAMPLRREGMSSFKSFMYGQFSGIVEPIAAVIGAYAVIAMRSMLPYALAFAAGAMIFVVIEELIPESQQGDDTDIATAGAIFGFTAMMILDVALG